MSSNYDLDERHQPTMNLRYVEVISSDGLVSGFGRITYKLQQKWTAKPGEAVPDEWRDLPFHTPSAEEESTDELT